MDIWVSTFLAIVNNAITYIHIQVLVFCFHFSGVYSGSYGKSMFNLLKNCQIVFQSGCTQLHPHQQYMKALISPHLHQHLLSSAFSNIAFLVSVKWLSHCDFDLHFPHGLWCWAFFPMLFGHWYIFGEVSVQAFSSFSDILIIFYVKSIIPRLLFWLASLYLTVCYGDLSVICIDFYSFTSLFLSTYSSFHSLTVL